MPRVSRAAARNGAGGDPLMPFPSLQEPRFSQSLERGLAILTCFTSDRPTLGVADKLGMSRSTTHRYIITLQVLGYLEQNSSRKYRLGLRVTDLGTVALNCTGLRDHSRPLLEELRRRTSYTVNLAILDRTEILYVDRARCFRRGQREIDLNLARGSRLPAYCAAMGKMLLAHLPEQEQHRLVSEMKLSKRGPNTITSKVSLRAELDSVLRDGLAVNDPELTASLHSISAPVRSGSSEVVAAVNLAAHSSMIPLAELIEELGPPLVSTAAQLSAHLGFEASL